jgi:hypothetical protein
LDDTLDLNEKRWKCEQRSPVKSSFSQKFKISGSRKNCLEIVLVWAWKKSGLIRPATCNIDAIPAADWQGCLDDLPEDLTSKYAARPRCTASKNP